MSGQNENFDEYDTDDFHISTDEGLINWNSTYLKFLHIYIIAQLSEKVNEDYVKGYMELVQNESSIQKFDINRHSVKKTSYYNLFDSK